MMLAPLMVVLAMGYEVRDARLEPAVPRFELRGRFVAEQEAAPANQRFVLVPASGPKASLGCAPPTPDGIFRNGFE